MSDQASSASDVRVVAIVSLIVAFVTTIALESKELQFARPRSLSSTPVALYQLPRSNLTGAASIPHNFLERVECELPIPDKRDTSDSRPSTQGENGCVKFYPERFFQTVAIPFQQQYLASKQVKTEHPVVHMTLQDTMLPPSADGSNYPMSLTYFHVRKCGGTTMFRSLSNKSVRVPYSVNKYNRMMIDKMGIVRDIHNQQQIEQKIGLDNTAVVFSFVRDPVVRFLSSVGQMLHMGKVKQFPRCLQRGEILQEIARKQSNTSIAKSQALVHCILQSIQQTVPEFVLESSSRQHPPQFDYIDQHLIPQAYELRARALEYDIGIRLMSMEQIAPTLKTLVGAEKQNRHARPSRVGDYAQGYFLETSILSDEMIRDICHLYAVDVLLLKRTGVAPTLCSYAPKAIS